MRQSEKRSSLNPFMILNGIMVCAFILATVGSVQGQTSRSSYWGTPARGMAGAYTAAGGNFSGISYNPANSASIRSGQFVSDFNQLTQRAVDVQNGAIGAAYRYGDWVHGVAFNRTDLSFDFGNFSVTSDGLTLDYSDDIFYYNTAWNITPDIHVASNLKYFNVSTSVEGANASGYGLDLGYMQFLTNRMTLGLSMKNLVGSKDWDSGVSEDVPMDIRAGLRYRLFSNAAAEFDVVYGEDPGLQSLNFGGEWWVWRRFEDQTRALRRPYFRYMQRQAADRIQFGLAFRGGIETQLVGSEDTNFSLGMGMQFGGGHLDYAFQQRSNFDNQHYFGFSSSFGGGNSGVVNNGTQTAQRDNRSDRSTAVASNRGNQSSFVGETVNIGLMQWQSDPGVRMATDRLEENLSNQSGFNISVYGQNAQIERSLIEDSLSDFQKNRLLEETEQDYLVTGELRNNRGTYRATIVIESNNSRETIQLSNTDGASLIREVSERIRQYILDQRRASKEEASNRKTLPVPYSVRVGLLQWNIDNDVNFKPEALDQQLERTDSVQATVYRRNEELEQSILHNALTPKQTEDLLDNVDKDYLVTGRITKLNDGYLATAYLLDGEQRRSLNVMHSDLNELVDELSKQIQHRVSG